MIQTERNIEMYQRKQDGASISELSEEYGISRARVFQIIKREEDRTAYEDVPTVITHEHTIKITPVNEFGLRYAELIEQTCEDRGIYCNTKVTKTGITINYEEGVFKDV